MQQGDHAAAEAAAGHPHAALGADPGLDDLHQTIDGGHGNFEVIAHGGVGVGHQLAEAHQIPLRQRVGGGQGATVVAHHVTGTAIADLIQPGLARFQRRQIQIAQRLDPVVTGGRFALLAAGVVFAVHQAAAQRWS